MLLWNLGKLGHLVDASVRRSRTISTRTVTAVRNGWSTHQSPSLSFWCEEPSTQYTSYSAENRCAPSWQGGLQVHTEDISAFYLPYQISTLRHESPLMGEPRLDTLPQIMKPTVDYIDHIWVIVIALCLRCRLQP